MALGEAMTVAEVAEAILQHSREALGSLFGGVALVSESGDTVRFVSLDPLPDATQAAWSEVPVGVDAPLGDVVRQREVLFHSCRPELLSRYPHLAETLDTARAHAFANLPMVAAGQVVGCLSLSWAEPHDFDEEERAFIAALAAQTGPAIERARLFERQRTVAETLQRAILPQSLPTLTSVSLASRYLPASPGMAVGGDWYDAFELADDRVGLVVGDVAGHGLPAASLMGQLRNGLRAYALDGRSPADAMKRVSRFLGATEPDTLVTAIFAVFDPSRNELVWANAGHVPVLALSPDQAPRYLYGPPDPPLGSAPGPRFRTHRAHLEPGTVVVLYTDGLVEHRTSCLDEGLAELARAAAAAWEGDLERFCDAVITDLLDGHERDDDLCLLAARVSG